MAGGERRALRVEGMWPYWLDGRAASTVRNDLSIDAMILLTGLSVYCIMLAEPARKGANPGPSTY